MANTRSSARRDAVAASSFFERRLLGGTGGLAMPRTARLQLGLAPLEQLGQGVNAVADVPRVTQVDLSLVQPADLAGTHLGLQARPRLRRDALDHAATPGRSDRPGGSTTTSVARCARYSPGPPQPRRGQVRPPP